MNQFLSLHLNNFFSHRDTSLDFSEHEGLILVEGINQDGRYESNGSGKSTLLEGIIYALTGNTLRNVSVNEVINRNAGKDTSVSLDMLVGNQTYSVRRYRKDTTYGDKLSLVTPTEDLSKRLNKDTQILLDTIFAIPYDVLVNTMLLGEGLSSKFTQLNDAGKKQLIESTLSLGYDLSKSRERANQQIKQLNLESSQLQGRVSVLENLLNDSSDRESALVELESRIPALLAEVDKSRIDYAQSKDELDRLHNRIAVLNKSILRGSTIISRIDVLDRETASLVQEIGHLEDEHPICSHCHQELRTEEALESARQNLKEGIQRRTEEMRTLQAEVDAMLPMDQMTEVLNKSKDALASCNQILSNSQQTLVNAESTYASTISQINSIKDYQKNKESYQKEYDDAVSRIEDIKEEVARYEYFYKLYAPTGILLEVLKDAIDYINSRIKVYTDILLDKSYQLSIEKGKISLVDEKGSTYQSLSNGEKRRLDISIQFSLHDYVYKYCGKGINILFVDEILDTLDTVGVNNIIEVLKLKQEYCQLQSIFVITHNNELKPYFDEVITVVKDKNGDSYIK